MKKVNKSDLIDKVAEKAHLSKRDAKAALDTCFDLIVEALLKGEEVNITNFGVFQPKVRKSREGTHPKKHTPLTIEEAKVISFRTAKELKEKINK